jgi:hypothetical protein
VYCVVQRLFAQPIPRQEHGTCLGVPEGKGEHSLEIVYEVWASVGVQMQDDFGIGASTETIAPLFELFSDLGKSVDFAVEGDDKRVIIICERLLAGLQIDDAQPSVAEADLP